MIAAHPNPAQFLHVDAKHKIAAVTLVAGYDGENNGFNFDGYGRGELLVSVPNGWRVRVTCSNRAPVPNSCAVVRGPMTITPAFRGASTPNPLQGVPLGQKVTFTFVASRVGSYRFASLVAGHEDARQWDVLEVTPAASRRSAPGAGP